MKTALELAVEGQYNTDLVDGEISFTIERLEAFAERYFQYRMNFAFEQARNQSNG
jgi:pheromone shutdown protein TraB